MSALTIRYVRHAASVTDVGHVRDTLEAHAEDALVAVAFDGTQVIVAIDLGHVEAGERACVERMVEALVHRAISQHAKIERAT